MCSLKCPICKNNLQIDIVYQNGGMDGSYKDWVVSCPSCNMFQTKYAADKFYGRRSYTKEEVIACIKDRLEKYNNDLISRQAAIKTAHFPVIDDASYEVVRVDDILALPSAQPVEDIRAMCGECDAWNQYKNYPQPGWIPCGEKEPTESGNYLLYRPHFWGAYKGQTTVCYWNGEFWSDDYCSEAERSLPVIEGMFWMPLPAKPWEGKEQ